MTRQQAERIIRVWQGRLGVELWKLTIEWDTPTDEDTNARTWRSNGYDIARFQFNAEWPKWDSDRFEVVVIHELLHLCHRDVDEAWSDLDGQLHRDAWSIADKRYDHAMEGFIDRMAHRLFEIGGPA